MVTAADDNCRENSSGLLIAEKKEEMRLEDPDANSKSVLAMLSVLKAFTSQYLTGGFDYCLKAEEENIGLPR